MTLRDLEKARVVELNIEAKKGLIKTLLLAEGFDETGGEKIEFSSQLDIVCQVYFFKNYVRLVLDRMCISGDWLHGDDDSREFYYCCQGATEIARKIVDEISTVIKECEILK